VYKATDYFSKQITYLVCALFRYVLPTLFVHYVDLCYLPCLCIMSMCVTYLVCALCRCVLPTLFVHYFDGC